MLEITALHLITPLFRATFMAILLLILSYIVKFFIDGYRYVHSKSLLILISSFILFILGAVANLLLSGYGYILIQLYRLEYEGFLYHHIGNIVYSTFEMAGFFILILFNILIKKSSEKLLLIMPLFPVLTEILFNIEIAVNIIVLAELIIFLVNVVVSLPTKVYVGKFMVITGLSLLILSRLLMLFPFFPTTDIFSSMIEVAGFSGLVILRQDVSLFVKVTAKGEMT